MAKPRLVVRKAPPDPSADYDESAFGVFALSGKKEVGKITVRHDGSVGWIEVDRSLQRAGLATQLYERAAREACKRSTPLRSDTERSGYSQSFWEKQVRKGRARCESRTGRPPTGENSDPGDVIFGRGGCVSYALSCPAPKSLSGARRRR